MIARLRAVAGGDAILDDAAAAGFAAGGELAAAVVAPGSAEAVAATLALCSAERWSVLPAGAGAWLRGGGTDPGPAIILSTARLAGVHDYEPADLTAGAGAGTAVGELQRTLAAHGQWLALDPPGGAAATIGAIVARGDAGPLRHAFGTPRDAVLGLELATGDGRLLRFGGRVVKNVAGYDVVRLVVGSRGALGVITRVHLRLRPLAEHDATWVVAMQRPDPAALGAIARAVEPAALEWTGGALLVRVHGNAVAIAAAAAQLESTHGARRLDDDDALDRWRTLADAETSATFAAWLHALPSSLPLLVETAQALGDAVERTLDARVTIAAHAGDGIVRVVSAPASSSAAWAALVPALHEARGAVRALGGSVRYEMPPRTITGVAAFEPAADTLPLMRAVRRHFDPAGILQPGAWLEPGFAA